MAPSARGKMGIDPRLISAALSGSSGPTTPGYSTGEGRGLWAACRKKPLLARRVWSPPLGQPSW